MTLVVSIRIVISAPDGPTYLKIAREDTAINADPANVVEEGAVTGQLVRQMADEACEEAAARIEQFMTVAQRMA